MNIPRAERMINLLHSVAEQRLPFSMTVWMAIRRRTVREWYLGMRPGVLGCALGYAAFLPEFQADGLTLRVRLDGPSACQRDVTKLPVAHTPEEFVALAGSKWAAATGLVEFHGKTEFRAGAALFAVTESRAKQWFGGQCYRTPLAIANAMQGHVDRHREMQQAAPVWLRPRPIVSAIPAAPALELAHP